MARIPFSGVSKASNRAPCGVFLPCQSFSALVRMLPGLLDFGSIRPDPLVGARGVGGDVAATGAVDGPGPACGAGAGGAVCAGAGACPGMSGTKYCLSVMS